MVIFGPILPHTLFGTSISGILQTVVQWGFYSSICFFFVAFGCLAWQQGQDDEQRK